MADRGTTVTSGGHPDGEPSPASPNLGLGRTPGLSLDELAEVVVHERGFVIGRATGSLWDHAEPFLTGYVKGCRRALFQVAAARFGPSPWHADFICALTDSR